MLLTIIAQSENISTEAAVSASPAPFWDAFAVAMATAGLSILIVWVIWYDGFGSLRQAPIRRNRMFLFLPFLVLSLWLILEYTIVGGLQILFHDASGTVYQVVMYLPMVFLRLALTVGMLIAAHYTFARRLKGFGLNVKTLGKDTGFAVVHLLAVYPLILFVLWLVMEIGRLIVGDDFNLQTHESLTFLVETDSVFLKAFVVLFAVFIVPVFEEVLFRGFLQTSVRTLTHSVWPVFEKVLSPGFLRTSICALTHSVWPAILLTSVIFSSFHHKTHAAALFVFSCGLGYAYERSGSLFRPIFMHMLFNGMSVTMMLLTTS